MVFLSKNSARWIEIGVCATVTLIRDAMMFGFALANAMAACEHGSERRPMLPLLQPEYAESSRVGPQNKAVLLTFERQL